MIAVSDGALLGAKLGLADSVTGGGTANVSKKIDDDWAGWFLDIDSPQARLGGGDGILSAGIS